MAIGRLPSAYSLPIVGGTVYNAGRIIDLWASPCDVDPVIAVKAAFSYTPMLIWTLFKPDPVDYLTDRMGGPHKRRRKRRLVGGKVSFATGGVVGKGAKWASFGIKGLERAGWYFLVVDATLDWTVNWTSMAMSYSGCITPGAGYASGVEASTRSTTAANKPAGTYQQLNWPFKTSQILGWVGGQISVPPGYVAAVSGSMLVRPHPTRPEKATVSRVYVYDSNDGREYDLDASEPDGEGWVSWGGVRRDYNIISPPQLWSLRFEKTDGDLEFGYTSLRASASEGIDPGIGVEHDP